jgi:molybdenum cofactor guanylyltransferase
MADARRWRVAGAVLTGGSSSRMGADKTLLEVRGAPLAAHAARALSEAGIDPVRCIGGDLDALRRAGLEATPDLWPGEGPLGGILTALRSLSDADVVVVSAGDLVAPDSAVVARLVDALQDPADDVELVVPVVAGRVQWLFGAWRTSAHTALLEAFTGGERAIHRAVERVAVRTIDGVDPTALRDADTPQDLADADPVGHGELA